MRRTSIRGARQRFSCWPTRWPLRPGSGTPRVRRKRPRPGIGRCSAIVSPRSRLRRAAQAARRGPHQRELEALRRERGHPNAKCSRFWHSAGSRAAIAVADGRSLMHDPQPVPPALRCHAMSDTPLMHVLRTPARSLQETCASLFGNGRNRAAGDDAPVAGRSPDSARRGRHEPPEWVQTHWSETSFEPHVP